jgi:hypothetical protein
MIVSIANIPDEAVTISVWPGAPAAALIRDAARQHLEAGKSEGLRWLCSHPDAPDDVLLEICDRGLYLDDLGHRRGPRRLLEKLADEHQRERSGLSYEIEDFPAYRRALAEHGIEAPQVRYRVFVTLDARHASGPPEAAWEEQIQRFFELTPATDVPCRIVGP